MCIIERREVEVPVQACVYGQHEDYGLNFHNLPIVADEDHDDHIVVVENRFDRHQDKGRKKFLMNQFCFKTFHRGDRSGDKRCLNRKQRQTCRQNGAFMATAADYDCDAAIAQHFADWEREQRREAERLYQDMEAERYGLMLDYGRS